MTDDITTMFEFANEAQELSHECAVEAQQRMTSALNYALESGQWLIEIHTSDPENFRRSLRQHWRHGESTAYRNKSLAENRELLQRLIAEAREEDPEFVISCTWAVKTIKQHQEKEREAERAAGKADNPMSCDAAMQCYFLGKFLKKVQAGEITSLDKKIIESGQIGEIAKSIELYAALDIKRRKLRRV